MAKMNVFGFVDNTDYLQEANEKRRNEKELEELENFLDAQIYLSEILDEGYVVYQDYNWDKVNKKVDKTKKFYNFMTDDEKFKARNTDYKKAFWDFYYQVVEWETQQEEEAEREEKERIERLNKMDEIDFYFG